MAAAAGDVDPESTLRRRQASEGPSRAAACCPARASEEEGKQSRVRATVHRIYCSPLVRCVVAVTFLLFVSGVPGMRNSTMESAMESFAVGVLQSGFVKLRENRKTNPFRMRKKKTRPEEVYTVYLDGKTPTEVTREEHDDPLFQAYYHIKDATKQGIQFDKERSRIRIPFGEFFRGTYSRMSSEVMTSEDGRPKVRKEYGYFVDFWGPQPMAQFGGPKDDNNVRFFRAEKSHALRYVGPKSDLPEPKPQKFVSGRIARTLHATRNKAITMFIGLGNLGPQLAGAGFDFDFRGDLRTCAQEDVSATMTARKNSLKNHWKLASVWEQTGEVPVVSSSSNCQHFESTPEAIRGSPHDGHTEVEQPSGENTGGVWVKLDKNVVMYRGQIPFAPVPMFDYITGLTHFSYDEDNDVLEYFDLGSGVLHLEDTVVFHRSPVDGLPRSATDRHSATAHPITADSRHQVVDKPDWKARAAYSVYKSMPNDRRMFFQDEDDACPKSKEEKLTKKMNQINTYRDFYFSKPSLGQQMSLLNIVAEATPCGVDWMQSPLPQSHGYDLFEGLVWSHFIMEAPDGNKGKYVFYDGWNYPPDDLTIKVTKFANGGSYQDRPDEEHDGSLLQKGEDTIMTAAEKKIAEDAMTCHDKLLDEIGSGRVPTFECPEYPESLLSGPI